MEPAERARLNDQLRSGAITFDQWSTAMAGGATPTARPPPEAGVPAPATPEGSLAERPHQLPTMPDKPIAWDPNLGAFRLKTEQDAGNRNADVAMAALARGTPDAPAAGNAALADATKQVTAPPFPQYPTAAEAAEHSFLPRVVEPRSLPERLAPGITAGVEMGGGMGGVRAGVGAVTDSALLAARGLQLGAESLSGVPREDWSQYGLRMANASWAAFSELAGRAVDAYHAADLPRVHADRLLAERGATDPTLSPAEQEQWARTAADLRGQEQQLATPVLAPVGVRTGGVDYVSPEARANVSSSFEQAATNYLLDVAAKTDTSSSAMTDFGRTAKYNLDQTGGLPDWFKSSAVWLAWADGLAFDMASPDAITGATHAAGVVSNVARDASLTKELASVSWPEAIASGVLRGRADVRDAALHGVQAASDSPGGLRAWADSLTPKARDAVNREVMANQGRTLDDLVNTHEAELASQQRPPAAASSPSPPPPAPPAPAPTITMPQVQAAEQAKPSATDLARAQSAKQLAHSERVRLEWQETQHQWLLWEQQAVDTKEAAQDFAIANRPRLESRPLTEIPPDPDRAPPRFDSPPPDIRLTWQEAQHQWLLREQQAKEATEAAQDAAIANRPMLKSKPLAEIPPDPDRLPVRWAQGPEKAAASRLESPAVGPPAPQVAPPPLGEPGDWQTLPSQAKAWDKPPAGKHALYEHPEYQRLFGPSDPAEARYHISSADGGRTYLSPAMTLEQAAETLAKRNPLDRESITWDNVRRVGGWRVRNTAERASKELFAGDRMASSVDEYNVINGWANRKEGLDLNRAMGGGVRAQYLGRPRRGLANPWPVVDAATNKASEVALKLKRVLFGIAPPARGPALTAAAEQVAQAAARVSQGRFGQFFSGEMMAVGHAMVPQGLGEALRGQVEQHMTEMGLSPADLRGASTTHGHLRVLPKDKEALLRQAVAAETPEVTLGARVTMDDLYRYQLALEQREVEKTGQALRRTGQYQGLMGQVVVPAARKVASKVTPGRHLGDLLEMVNRANLPLPARQAASRAAAPIRELLPELHADILHLMSDPEVTFNGAATILLKDAVRVSPQEAQLASDLFSGHFQGPALMDWSSRAPPGVKNAREAARAWAIDQRVASRDTVFDAVAALLGEDLQDAAMSADQLKSQLGKLFDREPRLFDQALSELASKGMPTEADKSTSALADLARRATGNPKAPLAQPGAAAVAFLAAGRRQRAYEQAADILVASGLGTRDPKVATELERLFHGEEVGEGADAAAAYRIWVNNGEPIFDRGGRAVLEARTSTGVAAILRQAFERDHLVAPTGGWDAVVKRWASNPVRAVKSFLKANSHAILQGFPPTKTIGQALTNFIGSPIQEYLTQGVVSPARANSWWLARRLLGGQRIGREVAVGKIAGQDAAEFLAAAWRNGLAETAIPIRGDNILESLGMGRSLFAPGTKAKTAEDFLGKTLPGLASEVNGTFELARRLDIMQARVAAGASLDEAAVAAREALFEASNMAPVEREVLRYLFPFYAYMRSEFLAGAQALLERPERLARPAEFSSRWNMLVGADPESWGGGNSQADERLALFKSPVPMRPVSGLPNPRLDGVFLTTGATGTWSVFHLYDLLGALANTSAALAGILPFGVGAGAVAANDELQGEKSVTSPTSTAATIPASLLATPYVGRIVANLLDAGPRKLNDWEDPDKANMAGDPAQSKVYVAGGTAQTNERRIRDQVLWQVVKGLIGPTIETHRLWSRAYNAYRQQAGEPWVGEPPDPDVPAWMQTAAAAGAHVEKEVKPQVLLEEKAAAQDRAAKRDVVKKP